MTSPSNQTADLDWSDPRRLAVLPGRMSIAAILMAIGAWLILELLTTDILTAGGHGRSNVTVNSLITDPRDHRSGNSIATLSRVKPITIFVLLAVAAIQAVFARVARFPWQRRPTAHLLLFLTVATVLAPIVFSLPIGIFDEGFVVSGAMLIRQGNLPIRDFYVIYGPGQYYLTAGVFALFGEDLIVSRAMHVILLALLGVVVAACASTLVARTRVLPWLVTLAYLFAAGIVWINPGYAAAPATLFLLCSCFAFAIWAETGTKTSLLGASLLIGFAGAFRWDFGVFGLLALMLATGWVHIARRDGGGLAPRMHAAAIAPAIIVATVAFTPFIFSDGAARWFNEVPLFLLLEFQTWRNLEFVLPTWRSIFVAWSAGEYLSFARIVASLAYAVVPPFAAMAAIAIAARRVWLSRGVIVRADAMALLLGLVALLLVNQMRVRSGFPQGFPALVAALPLIAYGLAAVPARTRVLRGGLISLSAVLFTLLVLMPMYVIQSPLREVTAGIVTGGLDLKRASILRFNWSPKAIREWNEYVALINHIRNTTESDEPIMSAVSDMSRLFVNDAMLYFLAERPAATRWVEMEPGLTSTENGQRELIDALERRNVRTVVLLTLTANEPNATSRSNGVFLFDAYVRQNFLPSRKFGLYEVLVRRGT